MRGLSAEDADVLRFGTRGDVLDKGVAHQVACEKLVARGCLVFVREWRPGVDAYIPTPLGLLALRVSVAIPAVSL